MTAAPQADEFLTGGGGKSASFERIGDSITGTIARAPEVRQQTNLATGALEYWDNGDAKWQLVVPLQTTLRDDGEDDGVRALYVKGSKKAGSRSLHDAVATAVRNAGAKGLEVGGTLSVTFVGEEPSQTRGFNPRKLYEATYKAPSGVAASGDFLGTATPQAPPANGGVDMEERVRQLIAAGITDPTTLAAVRAQAGAPPF